MRNVWGAEMSDRLADADHDGHVPIRLNPALTRDQGDPCPNAYYGAFRYMDRMFEKKRTHRREEIASIDLSDLSFQVKYLMRHSLILSGRYVDVLNEYPNLRGLEAPEFKKVIDPPLVLADPPRNSWAYFRKKGILL